MRPDYQNHVGTGTAVAAPPSESPSQIRDAIGQVEQFASTLHEVISHLESRLDTALTPIPPTPASVNKQALDPQNGSHLLVRITSVNQMLADAVKRIQEIRQRVEV